MVLDPGSGLVWLESVDILCKILKRMVEDILRIP